jgi:hypothetical protein
LPAIQSFQASSDSLPLIILFLIKQNRGPVFWRGWGLSVFRKSCGKADDDCAYGEPTADYSSVTSPQTCGAFNVLSIEALIASDYAK